MSRPRRPLARAACRGVSWCGELPSHGVARGARAAGSASSRGPPPSVVEGCRSRSARVRLRGGRACYRSVTAAARSAGRCACRRASAGATLRGTVAGGRRARRFTARLRPPPAGCYADGLRAGAGRRARSGTASAALRRRGVERAGRYPSGSHGDHAALRAGRDGGPGERRAARGRRPHLGSLAGSPGLLVSIPDPGSMAVLDAAARELGPDARRRTGRSRGDAGLQELPPGFGPVPPSGRAAMLSHLLAMRMPAAWNARARFPWPTGPL